MHSKDLLSNVCQLCSSSIGVLQFEIGEVDKPCKLAEDHEYLQLQMSIQSHVLQGKVRLKL